MKQGVKWLAMLLLSVIVVTGAIGLTSFASSNTEQTSTEVEAAPEASQVDNSVSSKAFAVCIAIGIAGGLGALSMGFLGAKSAESISRQPEMEGPIRTAMMLALVFIETAIIYALLVAIMVIFVL